MSNEPAATSRKLANEALTQLMAGAVIQRVVVECGNIIIAAAHPDHPGQELSLLFCSEETWPNLHVGLIRYEQDGDTSTDIYTVEVTDWKGP